jgi:hypothetical protein
MWDRIGGRCRVLVLDVRASGPGAAESSSEREKRQKLAGEAAIGPRRVHFTLLLTRATIDAEHKDTHWHNRIKYLNTTTELSHHRQRPNISTKLKRAPLKRQISRAELGVETTPLGPDQYSETQDVGREKGCVVRQLTAGEACKTRWQRE